MSEPLPDLEASLYPPITPGGSLLVAYQVKDKPVILVGGGNVAATRIVHLLSASAHIHLICPTSGLCPEVIFRLRQFPSSITHHATTFNPSLITLIGPSLVLTAIDDPLESTAIYKHVKSLNIPINIADVPSECDFYFGSVHRDGPLQIMVSTNGNGPKLANLIRRKVAESLPEGAGEAIIRVGELRRRLRRRAPGMEGGVGGRRMEWMTRVCEVWGMEELARLEEKDMERILEGWEEGRVPTPREVLGGGKEETGSWGWLKGWWEEDEERKEGPDEEGVWREAIGWGIGM